jgi:hypothetical protein
LKRKEREIQLLEKVCMCGDGDGHVWGGYVRLSGCLLSFPGFSMSCLEDEKMKHAKTKFSAKFASIRAFLRESVGESMRWCRRKRKSNRERKRKRTKGH